MKRTAILWSVALSGILMTTSSARAAGFTVLSGEQHVWGGALERVDLGYPAVPFANVEDSYDSGTVAWGGGPLKGRAEVAPTVWAASRLDALYGSVASVAYPCDIDAWSNARAEGSWVFRPNGHTLRLEINADGIWDPDPLSVRVTDITSGTDLYNYSGPAGGYLETPPWQDTVGPEIKVFSIDPTHEYRMYVHLVSTASFDGPFSGSIRATVPVPAPGAILLGAVGAGLTTWLHRRRML